MMIHLHSPNDWECLNVIFIRHAESTNNCLCDVIRKSLGGNIDEATILKEENKMREADCALSPRGYCQAEQLGNLFSTGRILPKQTWNNWHIYSSPMKRCLLTSLQVSKGLNDKAVTVFPFLFESHGCYKYDENENCIVEKGLSKVDIESQFPHFQCSDGMENGWYLLPDRESHDAFLNRAATIVDWIWTTVHQNLASSEVVDGVEGGLVLVTHGNLMNAMISSLLNGRDPVLCQGGLISHSNTGVTHMKLYRAKKNPLLRFCNVQSMNRVDHLLATCDASDGSANPLLSGNEPFKDHWVQEYLLPPTFKE